MKIQEEFTPLSWDKSSEAKKDSKTFIFSLTKNKRYKKLNNERSIWCINEFGPWAISFGFRNNLNTIEHQGLNINEWYEQGCDILPNNAYNTKYFFAKEFEVFKIII